MIIGADPSAGHGLMEVLGGSPSAQERAAIEATLVAMADEWAETKHRTMLDTETEWQAKGRNATGGSWRTD